MSEVVNIPQLRFPEFKGGWKESRIGKIYKDLRTGSTPSRAVKSYFKGDNPWITSGELKYNRISTTFEQISDEAIKDTNLVLYQPGTLFIAITGLEAPGTRGKCAINAVPSTTNQSCLAFRKVDSVDTVYMFYWYLKYGIPLYFKYAQGTKQQSFNNKIVGKFQIFVPAKPEQQKIAAFLSAFDNKIEQLGKKQELLGSWKKGAMQQIFSQVIRFRADDGSEFPDWEEKRLGDVAKITTGSSNRENSGLDGQYTFFDRSEDIRTSERYLFDGKAVIVAGEGSSFPPKYFEGKFDLHQRTYAIMDFIEADTKFIFYLIDKHKNYLLRYAVGSTVKSLRLPIFQKMPVRLPLLEEQTKIANFLSSIDSKIEQVGKQLDESKQFKKALLQQMFV